MCLKKQLPDDPETSAQGLWRGFGQPVYAPGDKSVLGCTQAGVYFQSPEGQKGNSGSDAGGQFRCAPNNSNATYGTGHQATELGPRGSQIASIYSHNADRQ